MDAHVVPLSGQIVGFAVEFQSIAQRGCDIFEVLFGGRIFRDEIIQWQDQVLGNSCSDSFDRDSDYIRHQSACGTGLQVIDVLAPTIGERRVIVPNGHVRVALVKTGDGVFVNLLGVGVTKVEDDE